MKKEIQTEEYSSKSTTYCISNLDKRKWAFVDTIHNILDTPGSNKPNLQLVLISTAP